LRKDEFASLPLNLDLTYRLARKEDLPKLEWMGEYAHFRRVFEYTFHEQKSGHRLMLVADVNNFPVGQVFMLVKDSGMLYKGHSRRAYLYSLRVMAPFQGLGIGTELLRQAEQLIKTHKLHYINIAVAKDNMPARRLYERVGYTIYAEDEGRWSYTDNQGRLVNVHEPCWMMEKLLD
jgi:ribosomal protein S18 acetylase RimI-like enzyme